jgi:di/tricarboxylate transporter
MMPLAFAAGLGGTITLVGTPPNIIAAGALKAAGLQPFGFFEFAWIGIPLTIAGIIYMIFIGKHLLPKAGAVAELDEEAAVKPKPATPDSMKQWMTGLTLIFVVSSWRLTSRSSRWKSPPRSARCSWSSPSVSVRKMPTKASTGSPSSCSPACCLSRPRWTNPAPAN